MLSAKRMSDGKTIHAYFERKENGPFRYLDCNDEVIHKSGNSRVNHFAHANPFACEYAQGESDLHRQCKMEIYRCLLANLDIKDVELEKAFGSVRPDIFAIIRGVPVAIEVQISSLSVPKTNPTYRSTNCAKAGSEFSRTKARNKSLSKTA